MAAAVTTPLAAKMVPIYSMVVVATTCSMAVLAMTCSMAVLTVTSSTVKQDKTNYGGLVGGLGDDLLYGGEGSDVFAYTQVNEFGDVIYDFEIIRDLIDLSALFDGNASLGSNVTAQQDGLHTAIMANVGSGMEQVALLLNVDAGKIGDSNFIF